MKTQKYFAFINIGENQIMFSVCLKKNISHNKMFWKKIFDDLLDSQNQPY